MRHRKLTPSALRTHEPAQHSTTDENAACSGGAVVGACTLACRRMRDARACAISSPINRCWSLTHLLTVVGRGGHSASAGNATSAACERGRAHAMLVHAVRAVKRYLCHPRGQQPPHRRRRGASGRLSGRSGPSRGPPVASFRVRGALDNNNNFALGTPQTGHVGRGDGRPAGRLRGRAACVYSTSFYAS